MLAVLFNKNKLGEDTPHAVLNWRLWYGVFGELSFKQSFSHERC
jgi:hypothetical protein